MAISLEGNWTRGLAFDVHTLSSTYLGPNEYGYDQWESERSEMGELLYQLKYQGDKTKLQDIVVLLDRIKGIEGFDYLIPIPPTDRSRKYQPVTEIAKALGARRDVRVLTGFLGKRRGGPELKNVKNVLKRERKY